MKEDILATINCDPEALDKFMRGLNDLPEWNPGGFPGDLQREENLREFLEILHLNEYFEVFSVFARCQEWWDKLPLFSDEEMQIWFGMDKPGHLIRFRTALKLSRCFEKPRETFKDKRIKWENPHQAERTDRRDMGLPGDLEKTRNCSEDEILVLFRGDLVTLRISPREIRIASRGEETDLYSHKLEELLYVYQDGEDLTKFGYQLVDDSLWEFQTASIVTTARAILIVAHRFGF